MRVSDWQYISEISKTHFVAFSMDVRHSAKHENTHQDLLPNLELRILHDRDWEESQGEFAECTDDCSSQPLDIILSSRTILSAFGKLGKWSKNLVNIV